MNDFKCGPNGNCKYCGELDYGGHDKCAEQYALAMTPSGKIWTFGHKDMPEDWRSWDCMAPTRDDLLKLYYTKYDRRPGQIDSGLIPVEVILEDVPQKYQPSSRIMGIRENFRKLGEKHV